MIGQQLDVVVVLGSDKAGNEARDGLIKKWLIHYPASDAAVLSLGESVGQAGREFSIEDLFPDQFYLDLVRQVYKRQLSAAGATKLQLIGKDQLCKRIERALDQHGIKFNKGSVAKLLRGSLARMRDSDEPPAGTRQYAENLFTAILGVLPADSPV